MGHSYASNYIHCVFSTRGRKPSITRDRQRGLYAYMAGIAQSEGFRLIEAGGTGNHVHLLILLPATYLLARAVQKMKGGSSRWMGPDFAWQEGYGAFSVSPSQVSTVRGYIQRQEQHHAKRKFEEEFLSWLRHGGVAFDERHVFG
jgi:putative transposase